MKVSKAAENRRLERLCDAVREPRLQIELPDRPLLAHGRRLTDTDLLAKLATIGVRLDQARLCKFAGQFPSAEALAIYFLKEDQADTTLPDAEDWTWISLTCLWERWCPEQPNFEHLDDCIQLGIKASEAFGPHAASAVWIHAWQAIEVLLDDFRFDSIQDLDECFAGTTSITQWLPMFLQALGRAGQDGIEWTALRVIVCQQAAQIHDESHRVDPDLATRLHLALAESQFELGNVDAAERSFVAASKLTLDPVACHEAWARQYAAPSRQRSLGKAEVVARRGVALAPVGRKAPLLGLLANICQQSGRPEEAHEFLQLLAIDQAAVTTLVVQSKAA